MNRRAFDPCPVCFVRHRKLPLPSRCRDKAEQKRIDLNTYLEHLRDAIAEEEEYRMNKADCSAPGTPDT